MNSVSNLSSDQLMSSSRGQLVRSWLPIVGAGLLVLVLSGGFPPATWLLLFQTFSQLNVLLALQGPVVILPLTVLVVQSCLLLIAWVLWAWIVFREGSYLMAMQSKAELDRLLALQPSTGELLPASQLASSIPTEQASAVATDQLDEEQDFTRTTDQLDEEQDAAVITAPLRRGRDAARSTAVVRQDKGYAVTTTPLRRGKDAARSTAVVRQDKGYAVTTAPLRRGKDAARSMDQLDEEQEFSPKAKGQARHVPRRTSNARPGISTVPRRGGKRLENPFDGEGPPVSESPVKVSQDQLKVIVEQEEQPEEDIEENDSPFVFGNPFDGPLPEVFKYDADLKRSVMEAVEEDNAQSKSLKAKSMGSQKTQRLSH